VLGFRAGANEVSFLTPDTYHLIPIGGGEVTKFEHITKSCVLDRAQNLFCALALVSRRSLERRAKDGDSPVGENQ